MRLAALPTLLTLLLLAACATPSPTATPAPPPTATAAPTATRAPTATLSPLQLTATVVGVRQQATAAAKRQGACQEIAAAYARVGRAFDPVEAARDPALADVDLHLVIFGTADRIVTKLGIQREQLYRGLLADCIGP